MQKTSVIGTACRELAQSLGDKPAFVFRDQAASFRQFDLRVNRLCNALASLGLRKGDRVAILSRNRPEYVETYCVGKAGLVGMPLNWRLAPLELVSLLRDAGATTLIADGDYQELAEDLRTQVPNLVNLIALDEARPGWISYRELLESASTDEPQTPVRPEDPLCLFYTSGTTGKPKGVVLTHKGLMKNALRVASLVLGLGHKDIALAVMPLFHVGGMWYHLFSSYLAGCTTVIEQAFSPAHTLAVMGGHQVTNIHLVPTMIAELIEQPAATLAPAQKSLRLMYYAGSGIPEEVLRKALQVFKKSSFVQSYGSTEGGVVSTLTPQDHLDAVERPGGDYLLQSCGRPLQGVPVRISGPDGRELEQGGVGEVTVAGDAIMDGYWNNPAANAKALRDGWFSMGDLGRLDRDGYLYILGRKHDMIVTGGENVFPHEVENVLFANEMIQEAAVFGVPDPKWVEKVVAAVVLRDGATCQETDIIGACRERLAGYKCPKQVFITDQLPKNPAGKVLKRHLREAYGN